MATCNDSYFILDIFREALRRANDNRRRQSSFGVPFSAEADDFFPLRTSAASAASAAAGSGSRLQRLAREMAVLGDSVRSLQCGLQNCQEELNLLMSEEGQ